MGISPLLWFKISSWRLIDHSQLGTWLQRVFKRKMPARWEIILLMEFHAFYTKTDQLGSVRHIIRRKYSYKKKSIKEPEWSHLLHWHVVLRQRTEELEPDRHICCLVIKIGNINAGFQILSVEEDMMIEDGDMIVTCAKKSSSSQLNWCCLPVSQSEEGHHGEGLTGRGWGSRFSSPLGRPWMILFATMMTMMMIMTTMTKMRATRRQREWDSHFFLPWVITIHANCNIGKEGHP